MTFRSQMSTDFNNIILNSDEFAETVSYTPSGSSAVSRKAVIQRENLQPDQVAGGHALGRVAEVWMSKDATLGIATVTKGFDTVSFPVNVGGSNVTWRIVDVLEADDPAAWRLLVSR